MCKLSVKTDDMSIITGAHAVIFSKDADADRNFLKDILKFPNIDTGGGWLIFKLPPTELAVHPYDSNDRHELYLMCNDIDSFISKMKNHKVNCTPIHKEDWGLLTSLTLPGGGSLGVYQPLHQTT